MAVLRQGAKCLKHEKTELTVALVRHVTAEGGAKALLTGCIEKRIPKSIQ